MARARLAVCFLVLATVLAACGAAAPSTNSQAGGSSQPDLVFGVIAPLTGSKAEQGMQFKEGAEVAVAELNARGGVLGRNVRLEILDDQGQPNEAAAAAQRLVSDPNVVAVIGPSSTASSSAAIPILDRANIPAISPSASTPSLVTDNRCFYITSLPLSVYGPLVAQYAVDVFGAKDIAVIHVKDDWGEGVTKLVNDWAGSNNVEVVSEASFTQGDRDFKAQLTSLLNADPDVIVLNTHYTEGALITRQARDLGYAGPFVGQGTIVYPQYIDLAEDAAEGTVSWVDFLSTIESEQVQAAVQKFEQATGKSPLQYHISTYDAVNILAAAIERTGSVDDRAKLCTAVGETRDFPGIVGNFSFNAERLPEKEIFIVTVHNDQWVRYEQ